MSHMVVMFHLFDMSQDIMVYENGACVKQLHPSLDDMINSIKALNREYKVNRIELCGNPFFINKYIKELKTDFSNAAEIEIIPH